MQMQFLFTVALAAGLLGDRLRGFQFAAMALAATGLVLVGVSAGGAATPPGILLTLLAALSWAVSNLVVKRAGKVNMMAYVIWASIFAAPPLLLCSLLIEGWTSLAHDRTSVV